MSIFATVMGIDSQILWLWLMDYASKERGGWWKCFQAPSIGTPWLGYGAFHQFILLSLIFIRSVLWDDSRSNWPLAISKFVDGGDEIPCSSSLSFLSPFSPLSLPFASPLLSFRSPLSLFSSPVFLISLCLIEAQALLTEVLICSRKSSLHVNIEQARCRLSSVCPAKGKNKLNPMRKSEGNKIN